MITVNSRAAKITVESDTKRPKMANKTKIVELRAQNITGRRCFQFCIDSSILLQWLVSSGGGTTRKVLLVL